MSDKDKAAKELAELKKQNEELKKQNEEMKKKGFSEDQKQMVEALSLININNTKDLKEYLEEQTDLPEGEYDDYEDDDDRRDDDDYEDDDDRRDDDEEDDLREEVRQMRDEQRQKEAQKQLNAYRQTLHNQINKMPGMAYVKKQSKNTKVLDFVLESAIRIEQETGKTPDMSKILERTDNFLKDSWEKEMKSHGVSEAEMERIRPKAEGAKADDAKGKEEQDPEKKAEGEPEKKEEKKEKVFVQKSPEELSKLNQVEQYKYYFDEEEAKAKGLEFKQSEKKEEPKAETEEVKEEAPKKDKVVLSGDDETESEPGKVNTEEMTEQEEEEVKMREAGFFNE